MKQELKLGVKKTCCFPVSHRKPKARKIDEKWKPKRLNKAQRLTVTPHYLAGWSKRFLEPNPALGRQGQAVRLRPSWSTQWVQTSWGYIVQPSLKKKFLLLPILPPPPPMLTSFSWRWTSSCVSMWQQYLQVISCLVSHSFLSKSLAVISFG